MAARMRSLPPAAGLAVSIGGVDVAVVLIAVASMAVVSIVVVSAVEPMRESVEPAGFLHQLLSATGCGGVKDKQPVTTALPDDPDHARRAVDEQDLLRAARVLGGEGCRVRGPVGGHCGGRRCGGHAGTVTGRRRHHWVSSPAHGGRPRCTQQSDL
jgi:hypothetical protein